MFERLSRYLTVAAMAVWLALIAPSHSHLHTDAASRDHDHETHRPAQPHGHEEKPGHERDAGRDCHLCLTLATLRASEPPDDPPPPPALTGSHALWAPLESGFERILLERGRGPPRGDDAPNAAA